MDRRALVTVVLVPVAVAIAAAIGVNAYQVGTGSPRRVSRRM